MNKYKFTAKQKNTHKPYWKLQNFKKEIALTNYKIKEDNEREVEQEDGDEQY